MDKKNIVNSFLVAFLAIVLVAISSKQVLAAVRCETQYGGGETCLRTGELQIDKEVFDSNSSNYVDNLGFQGKTFISNEEIIFKLNVKNVGDDTLFNIKVTDTLPSFLFFEEGFEGTYTIDKLNPGDSDERIIKARVVSQSQLPSDKSLVCIVNTAEATADNNEHDKDTAQFCLGQKVLGVTTLPKTGSNAIFFASIFSLISGLTGIVLAKVRE